jgi:hypothetical protein
MPYAQGRIYNDADAHVMETADGILDYADAKTRALLKALDLAKAGNMIDHLPTGAADPHYWDKVDIEKNLMLLKGWEALGASDSAARSGGVVKIHANRVSQPWTTSSSLESVPECRCYSCEAILRF